VRFGWFFVNPMRVKIIGSVKLNWFLDHEIAWGCIMFESNESVTLDIHLQEVDIRRELFWFSFQKNIGHQLRLLGIIVVGVFGLYLYGVSNEDDPYVFISIGIFSLILLMQPIAVFSQTKKLFSSLKDFQKDFQCKISESSYEIIALKSSSRVDLDSFVQIIETRHAFNFFYHQFVFYVIPKRFLKNDQDLFRMRQILQRSLGDKAHLKA
jgi:hypothetical protein